MDSEGTDSSGLSPAPSDFEKSSSRKPKSGSKRSATDPITNGRSNKRAKQSTTTQKKQSIAKSELDEPERTTSTPSKKTRIGRRRIQGAGVEESASVVEIEVKEQKVVAKANGSTTAKSRKQTVKVEHAEQQDDASDLESPRKKKAKPQKSTKADTSDIDSSKPPRIKRHRKTAEEKAAAAMPLAARTIPPKIFLGAHVSAAGGVQNAVTAAHHIGGNAFALFLKSQRKWENPALKPEHADQFRSLCTQHAYAAHQHVVPHGSYLVNLAAKEPAKKEQAYNTFLDDLRRCETLGIALYNFHPGNTNGEPRAEAIARLADRLNEAHAATRSVVTLLENMAAQPSGNTIGATFADLRDVIALIRDKSRVGVCLDTCHAFAAGYDLRTPDAFSATLKEFDSTIGLKYLRALHINDSKAPFASHRDLHANIGTGFLGLRAFHNVVNEPRFVGLPLVLETPNEKKDENGKVVTDEGVWAREIKLMEGLIGMDADGEEFKGLERSLAEQGAKEREKHQEQFDRKTKEKEKKSNGKGRGRKKKNDESEESNGSEDSDGN